MSNLESQINTVKHHYGESRDLNYIRVFRDDDGAHRDFDTGEILDAAEARDRGDLLICVSYPINAKHRDMMRKYAPSRFHEDGEMR